MWAGTWKQEYVLKERTSGLRNNLGKQKRKGAVLLLSKLRPYASNAAAVGESFMRVLLSLLSLSISPQFPVVLGVLEIACSFFGVG